MSDIMDSVRDWLHDHKISSVDVTTSKQTPAKPPKFKTPPGQVNMGTGIATAGQGALADRPSTIAQQIRDAGG